MTGSTLEGENAVTMDFSQKILLGRTGLRVGRLGISSSFGLPTAGFEEAFERDCNYFTWGTFLRGRSSKMARAVKNIAASGRRDQLVLGIITYAHSARLTEYFLVKGLKTLGLEYADVLLLGWFPKQPAKRILDGALQLKERGLVRYVGLTSHNRKLFPDLAREGHLDIFHIRYNAAHRGAESETFPFLKMESRPGVVSFTATDWKRLIKQGKMPPGEAALSAADCYRFVLSHPAVDVCMMGVKTVAEMRDNLSVLNSGPMAPGELERVCRIGDYVHG